jgi:hypothetical protein
MGRRSGLWVLLASLGASGVVRGRCDARFSAAERGFPLVGIERCASARRPEPKVTSSRERDSWGKPALSVVSNTVPDCCLSPCLGSIGLMRDVDSCETAQS